MKIADYQNEDALDLLADLIDPIQELAKDNELKGILKNNNYLTIAKYLLKNHKKEIIEILARIDGDPEHYTLTIPKMIKAVVAIKSDEDLLAFFSKSSQNEE